MKAFRFFLFSALIPLALTACNLDQGVDATGNDANTPDATNNPEVNDTTGTPLSDSDGNPEDEKTHLLRDTVNGEINEMVYQGDNGLRIEWTEKNTANPIQKNDVVMVNYKARVAGGEQYDSNEKIGEPVPIKSNIGMMVKGWEEGLLYMNVGDKGRIMIPNALGYGEDGYLTIVPPKADLIIDLEIIEKIEPEELEGGLKVYKWLRKKGATPPEKEQWVTFDYFAYTTGADGHLYDNSYRNGDPFRFQFENDNVIDGLHVGMSVIGAGENAFIEIPAEMAYKGKGLVDLVPKNTDIVYDVRVLDIE